MMGNIVQPDTEVMAMTDNVDGLVDSFVGVGASVLCGALVVAATVIAVVRVKQAVRSGS